MSRPLSSENTDDGAALLMTLGSHGRSSQPWDDGPKAKRVVKSIDF